MTLDRSSADYAEHGCTVLRGIVDSHLAEALADRLLHAPAAKSDAIGIRNLYGDPVLDRVLPDLAPRVATVARELVVPTYSFGRVYALGEILAVHRDRPACEHSVSVHLGASDPAAWPLWVRTRNRQRVSFDLAPGDGVAYQGIELQHWRSVCPVEWYAQAFFHFVSLTGPNAGEALDRRPALGLDSDSRAT